MKKVGKIKKTVKYSDIMFDFSKQDLSLFF